MRAGAVDVLDPLRGPHHQGADVADREEITIGLVKGESFTAIAQRINKVPSTVSREVAANGGRDDYRAWASYLRAEQRCRRPKPTKLASCPELFSEVTAGLKAFWSPQEISRRLRIDFADDPMMQVSHETIYQSLFVQARGRAPSRVDSVPPKWASHPTASGQPKTR